MEKPCLVKMVRLTLSSIGGGFRGVDVQPVCPTGMIHAVGTQPLAQRIMGIVHNAIAAANSVTADGPAVFVCKVVNAGAAAVAIVLLRRVGSLSLPAFRQRTRTAAVYQLLLRVMKAVSTQSM